MSISAIPHWDLSNVFPSIESGSFEAAVAEVASQVATLEKYFGEKLNQTNSQTPLADLASTTGEVIERFNVLYEPAATIQAYIYSFISTNSRDKVAMKKLSEFEQVGARMQNLSTQFQAWIGKLAPVLDGIVASNQSAAAHAFSLREAAEQSSYMMSAAEESLASELNLSGASAISLTQATMMPSIYTSSITHSSRWCIQRIHPIK